MKYITLEKSSNNLLGLVGKGVKRVVSTVQCMKSGYNMRDICVWRVS